MDLIALADVASSSVLSWRVASCGSLLTLAVHIAADVYGMNRFDCPDSDVSGPRMAQVQRTRAVA